MRFRFMFMCVMLVLALTATYAAAAPIHDAAGKGDLAKVKALLKKDPKLVNLADKDGATPLHYATSGNHKSVVELLLSKNANVNVKKKNGVTPLHIAAAMGRTEIAKLLLAKGAKVDAVDNKDRTPISLAEESGQTEMIELLAAESAKPTSAIAPGIKIGDVCVNPKDSAEMVWVPAGEFLMGSDDAEDNEKPQRRVYLDGYWIYKYEVTVAQYRKFCEATGRNMPNAPKWGWKDDHPMVMVGWQDAVDYTFWAGASLPTEAQWEKAARGTDGRIYPWGNKWDASKCANSLNNTQAVGNYTSGLSPYGCLDMAGNVSEFCADWYDKSYYYSAPARNPTGPSNGSIRVLRGGSWNDPTGTNFRSANRYYNDPQDRYEYRPGSAASTTRGFRCVLPADRVLKPDTPSDDTGHTPNQDEIDAIMQAAKDGDLAKVQELVSANPRLVNVRDEKGDKVYVSKPGDSAGNTPLLWTARQRYVAVAEWLIEQGADVNARGMEGQTPLYYATDGSSKDFMEMLLRHGADINVKLSNGDTPLHLAAFNTTPEVVEFMISKGADVNATQGSGLTPLHGAMMGQRVHLGEAKALIEHGANVNARTTRAVGQFPAGSTPLKMALIQGRQELVDLLRKHGGTE